MSNFNKTPYLQEMKSSGGTLYVFPSASEDIGLNLNSRINSVSLSHYALLDIPVAKTETLEEESTILGEKNHFNISCIPGQYDYMSSNADSNSYSRLLAMSLQNYAMNFETVLLNQDTYDYSEMKTVSERVFWKWLKETGAIRWQKDADVNKVYQEEESENYSSVVKCLGTIGSGNSLSTEFGMYNETYVNIPTSYGQGKVFFKCINDKNYPLSNYFTCDPENLEGRSEDTGAYVTPIPFGDVLNSDNNDYKVYSVIDNGNHSYSAFDGTNPSLWYNLDSEHPGKDVQGSLAQGYLTDSAISDSSSYLNYFIKYQQNNTTDKDAIYYLRSRLDGVEIVKDLTSLNNIMKRKYGEDNIYSYDNINIDSEIGAKGNFNFNAILLYYSVYDGTSSEKITKAINLFGILFLDGIYTDDIQTGPSIGFHIPSLKKIKSSDEGFGTGYSFRVNIKSSSIYDSKDSVIQDNTTSSSVFENDMNAVIQSLNSAISNLNVNSDAIKQISEDYIKILSYYEAGNKALKELNDKINRYMSGETTSQINADKVYSKNIIGGKDPGQGQINLKIPYEYDELGNSIYKDSVVIKEDSVDVKTDLNVEETLNASNAIIYDSLTDHSYDKIYLQSSNADTTVTFNEELRNTLKNLVVKKKTSYDVPEGEESIPDSEYYIVPSRMDSMDYLLLRDSNGLVQGINYSKMVPLLLKYCQYLDK